jgi:hypothetical protein
MSRWFERLSDEDWKVAGIVLLLGVATRIPFACPMAFTSDSARFALALSHFDVSQMRPHAPGYILYVALAKLISAVAGDATASLVAVSVISSGLAAMLTFLLVSRMYGRASGLVTSLLLLTSPLFWYNGEMPLTYALEGMLTVAFAVACYEVVLGKTAWLLPAVVLLGLAAGVRQTLLFVLAPLLFYAMRKCNARQIVVSVLICAATCAAWLIPMIALSGGLEQYTSSVAAQYRTWVLTPLPWIVASKIRSGILLRYLFYSLWLAAVPVIFYCARTVMRRDVFRDQRVHFLLLWIVPSVIYFVGFNIYNPGHVVFLLPALFVMAGEGIFVLAGALRQRAHSSAVGARAGALVGAYGHTRWRMAGVVATTGVIAVTNAFMFCWGTGEMSYAAIKRDSGELASQVHLTRKNFSAERSMIVTCRLNTQAGLYLPEFLICCPLPMIFQRSDVPIEMQNVYFTLQHETTPKTYWIPTGFRIAPILIPNQIDTLIFWEEEVARYCQNADRLAKLGGTDPSVPTLFYVKLRPGERLHYDYHSLRIE